MYRKNKVHKDHRLIALHIDQVKYGSKLEGYRRSRDKDTPDFITLILAVVLVSIVGLMLWSYAI